MRILKRNLAFVLVMAMAIGMMVTANAANVEDYRDANDIKFTEAVDVLTALGVLEGENGTFHPERVLTREEGAKIITYLMLGADGAESLNTSVAPFADVAAGRWSAGFIAYCVSQGIVGGYGNGTFGPTDTLTGTQFAKMLLVALGYGVNGEFTGANWEIETNKQALLAGVYEGNLGVNFSNGVKREEAAQYAFNTLSNCATVSYSDLTGAYYTVNVLNTNIEVRDDQTNTLGYQLYNLKKNDNGSDEFGRTCHVWKQNAKVITGKYHDEAEVVYTSSVKASKIYADLGLTNTLANIQLSVIVDGDEATLDEAFELTKNNDTKTGDLTINGKEFIGNGVIVEAYVDTTTSETKEIVTLVVIHTYLGKVEDYDTDKNEVTVNSMTFETATEYEKEDLVMYTVAGDKLQSVKPVKTVEGKVESLAGDYVRFDGDKYNHAFNADVNLDSKDDVDGDPINFDNTYAMIVDDYGYVVGFDLVEESGNDTVGYLYLYTVKGTDDAWDGQTAKAQVRFLDGTGKHVVELLTREKNNKLEYKYVDENNATQWEVVTNLESNITEGFYAYTVNSDDQYTLKSIYHDEDVRVEEELNKDVAFDGKTTGKIGTKASDGTMTGNEYTVNARTVAKVVDGDNKVSTFTGYKNIKITATSTTANPINTLLVYANKSNTLVSQIFVVGDAESEGDAVFAYYNGKTEDRGDADGLYYQLFIGTNEEWHLCKDGSAFTGKGMYRVVLNDKDEVTVKELGTKYAIDGDPSVADDAGLIVVTEVNGDTVKATGLTEGSEFVMAEDCVVRKFDSDGNAVNTSVAKNNKVVVVFNTETEQAIEIFVVKTK